LANDLPLLRGQGPRDEVATAAAYTAGQRHAICNKREAEGLSPASAPDRSRAATATRLASTFFSLGDRQQFFKVGKILLSPGGSLIPYEFVPAKKSHGLVIH
jgi:hypothetical protein